ncbi:MAG: 16S rRNA (adenine(1518)-N(6)/adenine(1519)-N(6))-dimethyltransferase RsmA [Hyphomicrobiaceae bacterium]
MTGDGLPPLRQVIRTHGLAAKKSLGQNFILDLNLTAKIARKAGDFQGHTVVEIGPGPGGLTRALLAAGAGHIIAIERDARCLDALAEISDAYPGRLTVLNGDALEFDYVARIKKPARIVANLPYSIATPLLTGWLTTDPWPPWWTSMTLMFQREVAERIVAEPGSKVYGRLAVLAQWRSVPKIVMTLPPDAFTPPPRVESSVVHFLPREQPSAVASVRDLERITAAAFGQRRKMLRANLRQLNGNAEALIESCNINPRRRAEELTVQEFCALANAFA